MRRRSFWHLEASLACLSNPRIHQYCINTSKQTRVRRYPARLLRYWFMYQLLRQEESLRGPLSVCEIGVDRGQMLHFTREAGFSDPSGTALQSCSNWDAVDINLRRAELQAAGYRRLFKLDLAQDPMPAQLHGEYDVVILLHILEHLREPEVALEEALKCLKPGGLVIGGMPVLPQPLLSWRQQQIRRKAQLHGHVSAFSPQRLRSWVARFGLREELCSGAFFVRSKRLPLENYRWWLRCNLAFGALFPGWPGEIYWSFRT
jgi:SAM-dependent methyltransferase